ncbi:hypothetical protein DHEL01_v203305 [Diaporthe helianthi]|uniref:Uncharacterized protein n=1 Tax=Diaporthe helianthi TaxID=158607 RepID=A0A2P5I750_DIAHE|nr:hypothetical protein DHEL01_v203305 [Diaporthe helianthi]
MLESPVSVHVPTLSDILGTPTQLLFAGGSLISLVLIPALPRLVSRPAALLARRLKAKINIVGPRCGCGSIV